MILRDFQIYTRPFGDHERQYAINVAAFPIYEAVRLDLKRRRPTAPFKKIVITLVDKTLARGPVTNALGICEAPVLVDVEALFAALPAVHELVAAAREGLTEVARATGFQNEGILSALDLCLEHDPPCLVLLERLSRITRAKTHCDVYFLARAGETRVEVRFTRLGAELGRTVVKRSTTPLFLEDELPVRRSRLRDNFFELLASDYTLLASVAIPESS